MSYTRTTPLLRVNHVSLTLGGRLILRDVNAEIDDITRPDCVTGQVICFLGPSGVGKTQLSRIIAGLQAPTTGEVLLSNDQPVRKGLVGMVPQNYPLFEYATVLDNLLIAGRQAGLSLIDGRVKASTLLATFDLVRYTYSFPSQLSGGTRQRVAIIRQLMCSEHYLVMDEPFSGLDLIMKQRACELITQVANRDETNTIIIVTHDVTEGMSVADTVWLMGHEHDPAHPEVMLEGARLIEQYDLAREGLCWTPDLITTPVFLEFVAHVKARFQTVK